MVLGEKRELSGCLLLLFAELVDFCSFLAPTEGEARIRKVALKTISDAVTSIWTEARVEPFGSFVTGLYLLSTVHAVAPPCCAAILPCMQVLVPDTTAVSQKIMIDAVLHLCPHAVSKTCCTEAAVPIFLQVFNQQGALFMCRPLSANE